MLFPLLCTPLVIMKSEMEKVPPFLHLIQLLLLQASCVLLRFLIFFSCHISSWKCQFVADCCLWPHPQAHASKRKTDPRKSECPPFCSWSLSFFISSSDLVPSPSLCGHLAFSPGSVFEHSRTQYWHLEVDLIMITSPPRPSKHMSHKFHWTPKMNPKVGTEVFLGGKQRIQDHQGTCPKSCS